MLTLELKRVLPAGRALVFVAFSDPTELDDAKLESQLRALGRKVGVRVTEHMFRHALAQALVDTAGLKVAQEVLGHAHISTTAATYARVDEPAMVRALERVADLFELSARGPERVTDTPIQDGYVFAYDRATAAALDAAPGQSVDVEPGR